MANIWSTEKWALAIACLMLVLLGTISGSWLLASLITLCAYIAWLYHRMLKLEHWVRGGTRISQAYEDRGFVGIIVRQLHAQKKAQNKGKRRTKRLIRQLHQNISALPDATLLLNRELQIEWCNAPASYLLNLRSPQDLGYKITNLIRDPQLLEYLTSPDQTDFIEIESPADPSIIIQIKAVVFGGGQFLLIARNISDQKRLQESLKNFVANASHELKSPLTVISGHLEMLEEDPGLSDNGLRSLQVAKRQAERMKELILDLLLLSQVESYRLAPEEGDCVSVTELMLRVMAALERHADRDRVVLACPEKLFLLGINMEIEGICINLIENAIKYTTPGTPVHVSWTQNDNDELVFSVEDRGPGIEANDLPRITERHYRGARNRAESSGSGLGLAIVKHAASKHGARFDIDSEPARGSRFSVTFPSYRCLQQAAKIPNRVALKNY